MAFITIDGENKIALQQGNGQVLNITHFVLANISGLGAEPADRIEAMPAAGDIVDTKPVTKAGYVNTNQVVYSLTLDSTIGDYTFNWIGLKDADGVLIAVVYLATPITKTATSGGVEGNNLVRNFLLQYSGIQATTAISAPASTWQIDFTTRLLQIDDRERLSNYDIYGHEAFFAGGFAVTLNNGSTYDVASGIGYVGGIRCELTSTQQVNVPTLPSAIWVDASFQGDINGREAVVTLSATSSTLTDYVDGNGIQHYVAKLADISAGGIVSDVRVKSNLVDDHEAKADPHPQYLTQAEGDAAYKPLNAIDVPVGSVINGYFSVAPNGFIELSGVLLSRVSYSGLWSFVQSLAASDPNILISDAAWNGSASNIGLFSTGDGSSTFRIPDLRDLFVRSKSSTRNLGSYQDDDFKSHNHESVRSTYNNGAYYTTTGANGFYYWKQPGATPNSMPSSSAGGTETRPKNIALMSCIKY